MGPVTAVEDYIQMGPVTTVEDYIGLNWRTELHVHGVIGGKSLELLHNETLLGKTATKIKRFWWKLVFQKKKTEYQEPGFTHHTAWKLFKMRNNKYFHENCKESTGIK